MDLTVPLVPYNLLHFSRKKRKTSKFFKCIQYQIIWRYVYKLEFKIETSFYFDHAWIVWIQSLLIIQTKGLLYCHVIKTKFVKTEKRLSWRSFATTKFTYTEHIKVQSMYSKTVLIEIQNLKIHVLTQDWLYAFHLWWNSTNTFL